LAAKAAGQQRFQVLTQVQKREAVAELSEKFSRATSVFVAGYRGLTVKQLEKLRGDLREGENEYQINKNSILKLASEGLDVEVLKQHFIGPTSIAISYGDPVSLAKVLVKYSDEHDQFEIKGGMLDGKALDEAEVAKLATLPTLLELRGQIAGLIQAPASKLARLLNEPGAQLARLVAARKDSLEE
jgi:large subunit ribosomal protein L10